MSTRTSPPVESATVPSHGTHRPSIPQPLTSFIGREAELAALDALLARDDVPLVTLTGPGGVGKTRIALCMVERVRDRGGAVIFVPLASVRDPDLVLATIAQLLLPRAVAREHVAGQLAAFMAQKRLLLVLDNLEQVVEAGPDLARLLSACPELTMLVTSRVRLGVAGEHRFAISPLPVPGDTPADDLATVGQLAAIRLFLDRGQAVCPDFALTETNAGTMVDICRLLDGVPLAIELAAARLRVLRLPDLLARLTRRLPLLTGGGRDLPERQQTIRATIAWSYDLLPADAQRCLRQLAVFTGGCTLGAAEAVCGAETDVLAELATLIDHSLVQMQPRGTAQRYAMLATVREFALEQLAASGEEEAVRAAHARALLDLARAELPHALKNESLEPIARLNAEIGNIRAALAWLAETGRADGLRALVTQLRWFWWFSYPSEGRRWFEQLLALPLPDNDPLLRELEFWVGKLAVRTDPESAAGWAHLQRARALAQAAGDEVWEAEATLILGCAAEDEGRGAEADALLREARELFVRLGNRRNVASSTYHLGIVTYGRGDLAGAEGLLTEATTLAVAVDNWVLAAWCGCYLALIACDQGEPVRAAAALRTYHGRIDPAISEVQIWALHFLAAAVLAATIGDDDASARLFGVVATASLGDPRAWPERVIGDHVEASVRARLGDGAYDAAAHTGQLLPVPAALAEIDRVLTAVEHLPAPAPKLPITAREQDVLRLIVEGKSDREIAGDLFLSHRTVENHVLHILAKLNAESRTAAATWAVRHGLV